MRRPRLLWSLGLVGLFVLAAPSLSAQQEQMDALASSLAREVQKSEGGISDKQLVVVDFRLRLGEINSIGAYLADQLSEALQRQKPEFAVLDRGELHRYLQTDLLSLRDLQDEGLALWTSRKIGARLVVLGSVSFANEGITLYVRVVRTSNGDVIAREKAEIPLDSNLKDLLAKPLPLQAQTLDGLAVSCAAVRTGETKGAFAAAGVIMPRCVHCPDPSYPEEARKHEMQGSVAMEVVIGADGRPISIHVVKGAPYDLEERAIEAVRKWELQPAMKDGKPVPVCVQVETTFRLF